MVKKLLYLLSTGKQVNALYVCLNDLHLRPWFDFSFVSLAASVALSTMRANPDFISTLPYHLKYRRIEKLHAFRRPDGTLVQYPGSQVISIARVSSCKTTVEATELVESILKKNGHLPDIVDAQRGYRSTGPTLGDRGANEPEIQVAEIAVRVACPTSEETIETLAFLRQCGEFDGKITLCRAAATAQMVVSDMRTHFTFVILL
jgi:hypothetical protein